MRFLSVWSVILSVFLVSCGNNTSSRLLDERHRCSEAVDILDRIRCTPGVEGVVESATAPTGYREFTIQFLQPMDHFNPQSATFKQRLILTHRDESLPMVLFATGYGLPNSMPLSEIAKTFGLNQLSVEHRYFKGSIPANADWTKLNIEQSANDFHRVTEAFKSIYSDHWVNTGHSKGGMTSVFHRRFFPDDLDGTLAYVAPISFDLFDTRYPAFIGQVGGVPYAACRAEIKEFQKTMLERRRTLSTKIHGAFTKVGGSDQALEGIVLDLPFLFWQYNRPQLCASIPAKAASDEAILAFLNVVAPPLSYEDRVLANYGPYFYQVANQLGAPGYETAHLAGLLKYPELQDIHTYLPEGSDEAIYDPSAMPDVDGWVKNDARSIMFVYGEFDPWTAGKFTVVADSPNAIFIAPQDNHLATLASLSSQDKTAALTSLRLWFGLPFRPDFADQIKEVEIPREWGLRP
ncbi:MAG: S28 family serine protease [Oligoflexales bacterium]